MLTIWLPARSAKRMSMNETARNAAAFAFLGRGTLRERFGSRWSGISDLCKAHRIAENDWIRARVLPQVRPVARRAMTSGSNPLREGFLAGSEPQEVKRRYRQGGQGDLDLFRDVMVLQARTDSQKGVVILKYTETFDAFLAFFDFDKVVEQFFIVLEPSWAGYADPTILRYVDPRAPVLIQCFTEADHRFIRGLDSNLIPVPLGPADWVEPEIFAPAPDSARDFDVIMVANWGRHKEHRKLFRALRSVPTPITVLLIGFPWGGRTAEDIRQEAGSVDDKVALKIEEEIPHDEVADRLGRSKLLVFLSRKEGDNKAVVEAMFSDVPIVAYRDSVGGATSRINEQTGRLTSYRELGETIFSVLRERERFAPRAWALENTGADRSSEILEESLRSAAREWGQSYDGGMAWKANAPNLTYRRDPPHGEVEKGLEQLKQLRR